jgi:transposase
MYYDRYMEKLFRKLVKSKLSRAEIAKAVKKSTATVTRWFRKYNLKSEYERKYNGPLQREVLQAVVNKGLSISEIAKETRVSCGTVQYWLRYHKLKTKNVQYAHKERLCRICGEKDTSKFGERKASLCVRCEGKRRHRKNKLRAVEYKGGKCSSCGYAKCLGALDFHHADKDKDPNWVKMRCWKFERIIPELNKCVLLCRNCHAEEHWDDTFEY